MGKTPYSCGCREGYHAHLKEVSPSQASKTHTLLFSHLCWQYPQQMPQERRFSLLSPIKLLLADISMGNPGTLKWLKMFKGWLLPWFPAFELSRRQWTCCLVDVSLRRMPALGEGGAYCNTLLASEHIYSFVG